LIVESDLPAADAIAILSGSSAYVERTHKAAELYREGRAPLVLLTDDQTQGGWSSALQRNPYFVERAIDELVKSGVPHEHIKVAPGLAASTRDEALIFHDYAATHPMRAVLLVTSPYHSRRALRTVSRAFADTGTTVGIVTAPMGAQTPAPLSWWLHVEGWRAVGIEYVKLVYYWFRY